ncbi:DUF3060 domain-containing protein [Parabacteroides sp. AM08-6]|uniref:DUF3060 domain-containing protein n=1 Tax=Parabacteroides sp. AM08-6 TaxID=2292053 RepID=UPI00351A50E1
MVTSFFQIGCTGKYHSLRNIIPFLFCCRQGTENEIQISGQCVKLQISGTANTIRYML